MTKRPNGASQIDQKQNNIIHKKRKTLFSVTFCYTCDFRLTANKNSKGDIGQSIKIKRLWSLFVLICATGYPDMVYLSLVFTSWTLLLTDQDQPHYCTAEIIDQASTKGQLQNSSSSTVALFPVSYVLLGLCVAPQSPFRLIWSLLRTSCPSHSWLTWILLSTGGTAACWGRNVAWHLWKRSWESKGWETNTHPWLVISVCPCRNQPPMCRVRK